MTSSAIERLVMPKWGLTMTQGRVVRWLAPEGAEVAPGAELVDVETEKIAAAVESPAGGVLRRQVAPEGAVVPVGGLLGVIADPAVADDEIAAFVQAFLAGFTPEEQGAEAEGPSPESVEVGGRALRYLRLGDGGEPVVLAHGFGGDLNAWLFNHEALAESHTVYALDLPGHGGSSKDVGDGSVEFLARVVAGFMDAVGLPAAHLVGHSLGGAVAAEVTLREPERALSLTLVSSVGLGEEIDAAFVEGFARARRRREIKPLLERLFNDASLVTRRFVDDVLRYKRLDGVDEALATIAGRMVADGRQAVSFRERLHEYPGPALAIWGAADGIVPPAHAEGLPPSVRVEVLPGAGHMPMMEVPAAVNGLLLGFVG